MEKYFWKKLLKRKPNEKLNKNHSRRNGFSTPLVQRQVFPSSLRATQRSLQFLRETLETMEHSFCRVFTAIRKKRVKKNQIYLPKIPRVKRTVYKIWEKYHWRSSTTLFNESVNEKAVEDVIVEEEIFVLKRMKVVY